MQDLKNLFTSPVDFYPGSIFHIYNRTNNKEPLFHDDQDRWRLLHTYRKYLVPFVKNYSYCLLDNHFHFQIQIKPASDILKECSYLASKYRSVVQNRFMEIPENEYLISSLISMQFSRFFESYAKYFNHKYSRKGNLFNRPFKRKQVADQAYFRNLICYIHTNPYKHYGLVDFQNYPWSSYQSILENDIFIPLEVNQILKVFGSRKEFIVAHDEWKEVMIENLYGLEI